MRLQLDREITAGVKTVVRYCAIKGCRPIAEKDAPCSRCGTWQSYPDDRAILACLRWTYRQPVFDDFKFWDSPLLKKLTTRAPGNYPGTP